MLASQATALTGEPCTAAPVEVLMTSPFFSSTMPASARSSWRGLLRMPPSVSTPHEALSATVSWILIFQSLMRESTISKQGITQSVARSTSAAVTPGPIRSRLSTNATSASARGAIMVSVRIGSPSLNTIPEVICPKSGWFCEHVHHHLAGDADLLADHGLAGVEPALDHAQLDLVGVLDGDRGLAIGQRIDRLALHQRLVQLVAVLFNLFFIHVSLWSLGLDRSRRVLAARPASLRGSSILDHHVAQFGVELQHAGRPRGRCRTAWSRRRRAQIAQEPAVDPAQADLDAAGHAVRAADVLGVDGGRQTVAVVVHHGQALPRCRRAGCGSKGRRSPRSDHARGLAGRVQIVGCTQQPSFERAGMSGTPPPKTIFAPPFLALA